ncbi:helix-turn-helix domain-containing protein [Nonomuraea typhae]|uniref:Helix-turn-helix domain-containing protein n=1 Tax=Nonomuraea typhae TaxID=2603600 RepID=A0ABW7Z2P3_9ACTN
MPGDLAVFDRQVALVGLPGDPSCLMEITSPLLIAGLCTLFERCWLDAGHRRQPTPRQYALVALLCAGLTDAAAARRLGVSERTVATEVRALMDLYGVAGRLQLGLALASTMGDLATLLPPRPGPAVIR